MDEAFEFETTALPERFPEEVYQQLFETKRTGILATLAAARETPYGQKRLATNLLTPGIDYQTFRKNVPLLRPAEMTKNPRDFVNDKKLPVGKMVKLESGATTGRPKETYYHPEDIKIELPPHLIAILNSSSGTLLFHEARDAVSYQVIDEAIKRHVPKARREIYTQASEVIKKIKENQSQAVYLTCQVSAARRFMHELEELAGHPQFKPIEVPHFFLELVAEPVTMEEIKSWYELLQRVFVHPPDITVIYALSEAFVVGIYSYKPGDNEIRYKVKDNRFVEVLDPQTGEPVMGEVGDVVITPLNKETGSIYPRYLTGDRAALYIDEQGNCYLGEIGRDPEAGQINLRGYKIYAPALYHSLRERFGFPVNLRFQLSESPDGCQTTLIIEMCSPEFANENQQNQALASLKDFLLKEYKFLQLAEKEDGVLQNENGVTIILQTRDNVPREMQKGWQILPRL
jgi:phenylacetate-coenzyme A ligase PaaK-like adenylate-forming protein